MILSDSSSTETTRVSCCNTLHETLTAQRMEISNVPHLLTKIIIKHKLPKKRNKSKVRHTKHNEQTNGAAYNPSNMATLLSLALHLSRTRDVSESACIVTSWKQ